MFGCDSISILVVAATLVSSVAGQFENWPSGQINTTLCTWSQPRAALLGDTVFLDGGTITWVAGLDTGEYGKMGVGNGNPRGQILSYNLSRPFSPGVNVTGILLKDELTKSWNGGNANSVAPNYIDGAMLANDEQFFLYGGLVRNSLPNIRNPRADELLSYRIYPTRPDEPKKSGSFNPRDLPANVTRYVAYGGAANAPSEQKSWYFSGLTSPTHGDIFSNPAEDDSNRAIEVSNRMITLDSNNQVDPKWSNGTIGSVKGRANPEVIWVPVGYKGILVVLGGVIAPHWVEDYGTSRDQEMSEKESPVFMRDIDIYDVNTGKWYKQKTTGGPKTRTRGCAVVASASDHSSHNIYYYGGYDGINYKEPYYDDVWVLSLPSFTWVQLNEGKANHGRAGHKCFAPYPDQMMIFGGYTPTDSNLCLEDGPVVLFNMTSGDWLDSYDPTQYGEYGVPDKVFKAIGGTAAGGAKKTKPDSDWSSDALGAIFDKEYDHTKIKTFYPYPLEPSETSRPEIKPGDGDDGGNKGGSPSWLAPVLGVFIGLIFLTIVIVLFCFWRRRKALKKGPSEPGTEDAGMRIMSWMRGQQPSNPMEVKAATVTTTEEMPASHEYGHQRSLAASPAPPTVYSGYSRYEMGDTQVMELDANTLPAELHHHHTGFTPMGMTSRPINNASPAGSTSLSKPSSVSGDNDMDDAISQSSGPISGNITHVAHGTPIVDSPTLAVESPGAAELNSRATSDVSMFSNRASHLRNLSDATVSSEGTHMEPRAALERTSHPGVLPIPEVSESPVEERGSGIPKKDSGVLPALDTPVSPPTADDAHGDDYISARPALVSPISKAPWEEDAGVLR
jgi:hypothetical protein